MPRLTQEQWGLNLNKEMGKQIFWRKMAAKLKKLADENKYKELKEKLKLKKTGKVKKKPAKTATKVTKATTNKTLSDKLKTATYSLSDKRKKRVLRTQEQSDLEDITSRQDRHRRCIVKA